MVPRDAMLASIPLYIPWKAGNPSFGLVDSAFLFKDWNTTLLHTTALLGPVTCAHDNCWLDGYCKTVIGLRKEVMMAKQ